MSKRKFSPGTGSPVRFEYGEAGNIRVLTKSDDGGLIVRPLETRKEMYVAISHTWGTERDGIAGIDWEIPSWLSLELLRALVEKFGNVWIDCLCIAQNNEQDKDIQIKDMHGIYGDAEHGVVVLTGEYGKQFDALRTLTELLDKFCRSSGEWECSSSSMCPFMINLKGMIDAAEVLSGMEWLKRVWTLQETVMPKTLKFVGVVDNRNVEDLLTAGDDLYAFVSAFDTKDHGDPACWERLGEHCRCTESIDSSALRHKVSVIFDLMHAVFLRREVQEVGLDVLRNDPELLRKFVYNVLKQLGNGKRDCQRDNDRVFGVSAILGLTISKVCYNKKFAVVFMEAVEQLVKHRVCALPLRPQVTHCMTWLPYIEGLDPKDCWERVKIYCSLAEVAGTFHSVVCVKGRVLATGGLYQMHGPFKLRISIEDLRRSLRGVFEALLAGKNFDAVAGSEDPDVLTMTGVALWMFCNQGWYILTAGDVETMIDSLYNHTIYRDEFGKAASRIEGRTICTDMFDEAAAARFKKLLNSNEDTYQVATSMLVDCGLEPLLERDARLVAKKGSGFVLYSVPPSVPTSYITYGFFKDMDEDTDNEVSESWSNVVAKNKCDVWDNHGKAWCCYINNSLDFAEKTICVGYTGGNHECNG